MQTRTSISHKLILYIFFLGIFVIVVVSLYSFITARNAILQRTFDQLTSLRVAKKEQVEQFFNDRIKEVSLLAQQGSSGYIKIETKRNKGLITLKLRHEILDEKFEKFFKSGNYYAKIYIVNDGRVECYNPDSIPGNRREIESVEAKEINTISSHLKKEKQITVEDYSFGKSDNSPHLYIASPLSEEDKSISGCIVFEIKPSAINNIMKNKEVINGLGESGEVYMVGPDSIMRSESRFYKHSILKLPVKTESVKNAFKSGEGHQMIKDYRGILTLSSYSRLVIPGLNWVIISEIDKREAMRPVYNLANEIVFLSIFIAFILFVAAFIISRTIAGPIIDLKNATISVRNGNLDQILPIKSNDELGELTENFNLMTSQLKAQQAELNEREVRMFTSFLDGQEDERQRLSRELHDGLGQMIIATKLKTETLVNSGSGINSDNISRLRVMFDSLVDEVRGISNNLMPAVLHEFGLEIALNQVCKEISKHSSMKVIFDSQIYEREIDKRTSVYIFRIAQEALNNAVKHSNATEIIVTLIGNEKMISLIVQDDGTGFNANEPVNENSRGLNSMRERVKLLNGMIDISKGEDHGTIVSVKIPLI
jgi:signal transduction histidine kinase